MRRTVERLSGLRAFSSRRFVDERGSLLQSYTLTGLAALGIHAGFQQAIQSCSKRGVLRGLHFQWRPAQGKLIRCVRGAIFDVVVDARHRSPTLGDHATIELNETNDATLWVPPGFAHGFMSLADDSIVFYECTAEWTPEAEGGILWSDPAVGIEWPLPDPVVSEKDRRMPTLAEWLADPKSAHFQLPGD